mgnify:FL=1
MKIKALIIAIVATSSFTIQAELAATITPPDGKMILHYEDGSKKVEKEYKDGKPFGEWNSWYQSGAKNTTAVFHTALDKNSPVTFIRSVKKWHENGNQFYLGVSDPVRYKGINRETGEPEAWLTGAFEVKLFDENGKILNPGDVSGDDNSVYEVELQDSTTGKMYCFPWIYPGTSFEDCNSKSESKPLTINLRFPSDKDEVLADGKVTLYYKDGLKKLEKEYKNGQPIGTWTKWYKNGEIETSIAFENTALQGYPYSTDILKIETRYSDDANTMRYKGEQFALKLIDTEDALGNSIVMPVWDYVDSSYKEDGNPAEESFVVEMVDELTGNIYHFPSLYWQGLVDDKGNVIND